MKALAMLALVSLLGCSRSGGNVIDFVPETSPPPGQYYDCVLGTHGAWLSVAKNGVVNVACTEHASFPLAQVGPCAGRESWSTSFNASFRGGFVSADSASGTLTAIHAQEPGVTASGTFGAKWDGSRWFVTTDVVANDGCQNTSSTTTFEACP